MRKPVLSLICFIGIVTGVFVFVFILGSFPEEEVRGQDGVINLEELDLNTKVARSTSWNHYPRQLLKPEEIEKGKTGEVKGNYGTFAMTIQLPDTKSYIIEFNSVEFATVVYMDGKKVEEVGKVSTRESEYKAGRKYCYYVVEEGTREVDITLQYANFRSERSDVPIILVGLPELMFRQQAHKDFLRFTILAVYLAGFILFSGLYLFNSRNKESKYFALICLLLAVREFFIQEQFIFMIRPDTSLDTIFMIQFVFIGLLVFLLFAFITSLFPGIIQKKWGRRFNIATWSFIILSVITMGRISTLVTALYLLIGVVMITFLFIRMLGMVRSLLPSQLVSTMGLTLLYVSLFNDMLHHMQVPIGFVGRVGLLQRTMILFVFLQMTALFLQSMEVERQLSETREKEAALAAKNETLQQVDRQRVQFLSGISHELKTPLTILSNYAQLTKEYAKGKTEPDEYTEHKMLLITSEAERMAVMVDQVLDIARIEEGRMNYEWRKTDVIALIREMVDVYYPVLNKNHNKMEMNFHEPVPQIIADEKRLKQVLINLINNAVRFTKNGKVSISVYQQGKEIVIAIKDTGVGMTEEQIKTIFQRYTTSKDANDKRTGTGLGLYIVYSIVQAHNGRIEVESEVGKGSTFTIYLPKEGNGSGKEAGAIN